MRYRLVVEELSDGDEIDLPDSARDIQYEVQDGRATVTYLQKLTRSVA